MLCKFNVTVGSHFWVFLIHLFIGLLLFLKKRETGVGNSFPDIFPHQKHAYLKCYNSLILPTNTLLPNNVYWGISDAYCRERSKKNNNRIVQQWKQLLNDGVIVTNFYLILPKQIDRPLYKGYNR